MQFFNFLILFWVCTDLRWSHLLSFSVSLFFIYYMFPPPPLISFVPIFLWVFKWMLFLPLSLRILKIHKHFLDCSVIFICNVGWLSLVVFFYWEILTLSFPISSLIPPWMVGSTPNPLGPLFRTRYGMGGWRVLPCVLPNRSQVQSPHSWTALIRPSLMSAWFQDCAGFLLSP